MNKVFAILLIVSVWLLCSYSSGPATFGAGDVTGSQPTNGTCVKCHTGSTDTTASSIEVRLKSSGSSGPLVTSYTPNNTYTITVSGKNINKSFYGFQLTAKDPNDNYIGGFKNIPSHIASGFPFNDPMFIEHNTRIDKDTSGGFSLNFDWTPKQAYGDVSIYGIVNAVDGDAKETNDAPGKPMKVVLSGSLSVKEHNLIYPVVYPNPFTNYVSLHTDIEDVNVKFVDINGQVVINTNKSSFINTQCLSPGQYTIVIYNNDVLHSTTIVKK